MKDMFIVSYHCDKIGDYFNQCYIDIHRYIQYKKYNHINLHSQDSTSNRELLHNQIAKYNEDYMIVIYAHGKNDKIIDNQGNDLINIDDAEKYNNAIVYSSSCYSANELGKKMHLYTCKLFFGHTKKAYIVSEYKDIFIELDNFALKEILDNENIEANELCLKINKLYDEKIYLMNTINQLLSPLIMHNRESYKIYKDREEYPN